MAATVRTGEGLHRLLAESARRRAKHTALVDPTTGERLTYAELEALSARVRDRLLHLGVRRGDRVGVYVRKSVASVAAILGALRAGAAYVPIDPGAPVARCGFVLGNCTVKVVVLEEGFVAALRPELERAGVAPKLLIVPEVSGRPALAALLDAEQARDPAPAGGDSASAPSDVAYILYTSGSTGKPKGVVLSHENATSFVDWCSQALDPRADDRFSSHAPFHFDLSILDLYVPFKHGATLFLVGEELGKNPAGMVELIVREKLTVWYSTPSVLTLLMEHGKLEEARDLALRIVHFAGEVFPVKHLRRLRRILPQQRLFNLYGPTETNVCTYHEIPREIPEDRAKPFPIGRVCEHLRARVVDMEGQDVVRGEEGELVIAGPGVMQGYWQLQERSQQAFLPGRYYKTGDVVVEDEHGVFTFIGRRDRMVKRRGYRIELGEIEAALIRHPSISEVASIAHANEEGVEIRVFYSTRDGKPVSLIQLKQFCAENLPKYMIPDRFTVQPSLPKTSTDKIDYQRLKEM